MLVIEILNRGFTQCGFAATESLTTDYADSADRQELTTKNAESAERKHILLVCFIALCSVRSLWLKYILYSLAALQLILRPRKLADFKLVGAKIDQHPMLQPGGLEVAQEL